MNLKQFSGTYFTHEDRIMFRFNTVDQNEYKFWLTRRITHFILVSSNQFLESEYKKQTPTAENVMLEFQQSDKQASGFTKAYEPGNLFPIGADAILVLDAKSEIIKLDEQPILSFDLLLPGGGNMNLKFPAHVMKNLILLFEELNMQARWGSSTDAHFIF